MPEPPSADDRLKGALRIAARLTAAIRLRGEQITNTPKVGDGNPRPCVRCGHAPLFLLVFTDGLVQRARHGCTCFSVPLYRNEAELVIRERHVSTARDGTGVAKRPASLRELGARR
jgi:hypothetical protein